MDIPYAPLSPTRLAECMQIMHDGNLVLRNLHVKVKKNLRKNVQNVFKRYSRQQLRIDLFKVADSKPVKVHGVALGQQRLKKILAVREIEWEIICGFSNMVKGLVGQWNEHGSYLTWDDMMIEGCSGLSDAIFHYTDLEVKFMTFAHKAVRNRLRYKIGRAKYSFAWPASIRKLYQRYEEAKLEFNHSVNFDELTTHMGLTVEQQVQLQDAMTQVITVGDSKSDHDGNFEWSVPERIFVAKAPPRLEPDQKKAIESANLNDWEMAVLQGYISGHYGWKSEVAKRFGKSRMAPVVTLKIIKNKVLMEYERAA